MMIYKKRAGNFIDLFITLPAITMFLFAGIGILVTDRPIWQKIAAVIILIPTLLGARSWWYTAKKMFSEEEEIELTHTSLILHDDPNYSTIYYQDIINCRICRASKMPPMLGVSVKPDAPYVSNSTRYNRWRFDIPAEESKVLFISLAFADIDPEKLADAIMANVKRAETSRPFAHQSSRSTDKRR